MPTPLPAGWAIDEESACSTYIHQESALPYLTEYLLVVPKVDTVLKVLLQYIAVNAEPVLSSSTYLDTPVSTLEHVVEYPGLAIEEDVLLSHLLRYAAHAAGADSTLPALWSPDDLAGIKPVLSKLVSRLCIFSLSPATFVKIVEPLDIFSVPVISAKYKYDALLNEAIGNGRSERDMVLEMYGGSSQLCQRPEDGLRARASYSTTESAHPYEVGCDEELEMVAVAGWAGRTLVEFDKRSCVAGDARLCFYADEHGTTLLGEWGALWGERSTAVGGRKSVIFPGNRFWIGFKCPVQTSAPMWGWKLLAQPIAEEES